MWNSVLGELRGRSSKIEATCPQRFQAWAVNGHLQDQRNCKLWLQWSCFLYWSLLTKALEWVAASFYLFNDGWWVSPRTLRQSASFKYLWYIGSGKDGPLQEEVNCHLARRCGLGKNSARPIWSPWTPRKMAKVYIQQDHQCLAFYS